MEGSPEHSVGTWCNGDGFYSVAKQISFEDVSMMDTVLYWMEGSGSPYLKF
jgi:hypothetical protein